MTPIQLLVFTLIVGLLFITRTVYRTLDDTTYSSDALVHLLIAREIRENGYRIPTSIEDTVVPGEFSYPFLAHYILAVVPEPYYETVDRYASFGFDLLFIGLFFILYRIQVLDFFEMTVASFVFIATPQLVRIDRPHGTGFSPRKFGSFLTSVSLLLFLYWLSTGVVVYFIASVVTGSGILLTSRFSTQAYTAILVCFSVLLSPQAIIVLLLSFLLSFLTTRGFYFQLIRSHLLFSYRYALTKQYDRLYDGFKSIDTVKRLLAVRSPKDLLRAIDNSILLRGFFDIPLLLPLIVGYVVAGRPAQVPNGFSLWIVICLGLFVLTSVYHLRFLGGAERYLEFALLPAITIVAKWIGSGGVVYTVVVVLSMAVGLSVIVVSMYFVTSQPATEDRKNLMDAINQLNTFEPGTVLCSPRHIGRLVTWKTPHTAVAYAGQGPTSMRHLSERNYLFPDGRNPTADIGWLTKNFSPDLLLVRTDQEVGEECLQIPETAPLYANRSFHIYRFESLVKEANKGSNG